MRPFAQANVHMKQTMRVLGTICRHLGVFLREEVGGLRGEPVGPQLSPPPTITIPMHSSCTCSYISFSQGKGGD